MRTYQARLRIDDAATVALDAYGALFGRAVRCLHARHRAGVTVHKAAFMSEFALTARQFNAVRVSLEEIERSYRQRLPELIADDRVRLASLAAFVLARRAQDFRDRYVSRDGKRRRSTREDAAVPVLVAKERGGCGKAKVEPGSPSPNGDHVRAKRAATLRSAAGEIPVREGDSSPASAMRVRRAS